MPLSYKLTKNILDELWFCIDHQTGSHQIRKLDKGIIVVPLKKDFAIWTWKSIINRISELSKQDPKIIIQKYNIKFWYIYCQISLAYRPVFIETKLMSNL